MWLFKPDVQMMKTKQDYEGLAKALRHKDTGVQIAAVEALGELGSAQAVEPLIQALNKENTCKKAAEILGHLGDIRAVEPLIYAFEKRYPLARQHDQHDIRCAIIEALGQLGDAGAQGLLTTMSTQLLNGIYSGTELQMRKEIQDKAVIALIRIDKVHVNVVLQATEANKVLAVQTLRQQYGDATAAEILIQALDHDCRTNALDAIVNALGEIGDTRAVEPLLKILDSADGGLRKLTMNALGKIGDTRTIKPLMQILNSNNYDLWKTAAEALEKLGWKPANDQANVAFWVAKGCRDRCVQIGAEAVDPLIQALHDYDFLQRKMAAEALIQIGDTRAIEPLLSILEAGSVPVSEAVAEWLSKVGDVRAVQLLKGQSFRDRNIDDRRIAIEALGKIGNAEAIDHLCYLLEDEKDDIRQSAVEALGRIGEPAVEPILASIEKVSYGESLRYSIHNPKRDIKPPYIAALVKIGTPAIMPLCDRLGTHPQDVSFLAIEVLVKIGSPVVEPICQKLKKGSHEACLDCLDILARIGGEQVIEPIRALLHDSSMRDQAARTLGRLGSVAIPILVESLEESYDWVTVKILDDLNWKPDKSSAGAAYWFYKEQWAKCAEIGTPALNLLLSLFETDGGEKSAYVLGLIGDKAAVKPLQDSLLQNNLDVASQNSIQFDTRKSVGNSLRLFGYTPSREFLLAESRLLLLEIRSQRELSNQYWQFGTTPSGKPEYKPLHEEVTNLLMEIHGLPESEASSIVTDAEH